MIDRDQQTFAELMSALAVTYRTPMSATQMELYFAVLQDLSLETVRRAVTKAMREHQKFLPTPAELLHYAGVTSPENRAEVAWAALLESFQTRGYDARLPTDPIAAAIIRVWWGNMIEAHRWWCHVPQRDMDFKQRDWITLYQTYAARAPEDLPRLPGMRTPQTLPPRALGEGSR